jgi:ATP phosphoribosyltransferase regulatory subunit
MTPTPAESFKPIPAGTRDILPDEMAELVGITGAMREAFAGSGYGEIYTPALEYENVLDHGELATTEPVYRLFDDEGRTLVLRSDMTIPTARLIATRYASATPPFRLHYFSRIYRGYRPQLGQPREYLQAGIELIGVPAAEGNAEALTVLCRALDAAGLADYRVRLGDASFYAAVLERLEVPAARAGELLRDVTERDFVTLGRRTASLLAAREVSSRQAAAAVAIPKLRGGPEILDELPDDLSDLADPLRETLALLDDDVSRRVTIDLGLISRLGYYTGAVFEVYDSTLGVPLGGGGRYDALLGHFGRDLPAVGFGLTIERVLLAREGEERLRADRQDVSA